MEAGWGAGGAVTGEGPQAGGVPLRQEDSAGSLQVFMGRGDSWGSWWPQRGPERNALGVLCVRASMCPHVSRCARMCRYISVCVHECIVSAHELCICEWIHYVSVHICVKVSGFVSACVLVCLCTCLSCTCVCTHVC